ncbi:MAG TPA: tetratricopeptide repeat protein [Rhodospirillales bacterium]|nr:tetratricopeptide repeat protein [Rhodospirillales bacterium]HJO68546.1 tetratricopeptide repeat protein [Rhodospirillales bacterium]
MANPIQDSLLREIDEDLRHERYAKLWKKYGAFVIAAAAALVIGVAGYQGWQSYDIRSRESDGEKFVEALMRVEAGRLDEARLAFSEMASDASAGYALLARFQQAAVLARSGDGAAASAVYGAIADDSGVDREYRDFALVVSALAGLDTADTTTLAERLAPLTAEDNPWRHSARELNALLAVRRGDRNGAREIFSMIENDPTAPAGIRVRAAELLAILGG